MYIQLIDKKKGYYTSVHEDRLSTKIVEGGIEIELNSPWWNHAQRKIKITKFFAGNSTSAIFPVAAPFKIHGLPPHEGYDELHIVEEAFAKEYSQCYSGYGGRDGRIDVPVAEFPPPPPPREVDYHPEPIDAPTIEEMLEEASSFEISIGAKGSASLADGVLTIRGNLYASSANDVAGFPDFWFHPEIQKRKKAIKKVVFIYNTRTLSGSVSITETVVERGKNILILQVPTTKPSSGYTENPYTYNRDAMMAEMVKDMLEEFGVSNYKIFSTWRANRFLVYELKDGKGLAYGAKPVAPAVIQNGLSGGAPTHYPFFEILEARVDFVWLLDRRFYGNLLNRAMPVLSSIHAHYEDWAKTLEFLITIRSHQLTEEITAPSAGYQVFYSFYPSVMINVFVPPLTVCGKRDRVIRGHDSTIGDWEQHETATGCATTREATPSGAITSWNMIQHTISHDMFNPYPPLPSSPYPYSINLSPHLSGFSYGWPSEMVTYGEYEITSVTVHPETRPIAITPPPPPPPVPHEGPEPEEPMKLAYAEVFEDGLFSVPYHFIGASGAIINTDFNSITVDGYHLTGYTKEDERDCCGAVSVVWSERKLVFYAKEGKQVTLGLGSAEVPVFVKRSTI